MYRNFTLKKVDKSGGKRNVHEISIIGYSWHPSDWIEEEGHPVVAIVHGLGEYAGRYDRIAARFNEAGVPVVAMDLRGHGLSSGKRGDCAPREEVLSDITELIEYANREYPKGRIILLGHSLGGNLVLDYRSRGDKNGDLEGYIVSAPWLKLVKEPGRVAVKVVGVASKVLGSFILKAGVKEVDLGNLDNVRPYIGNPMVHGNISVEAARDGYEIGKALYKGRWQDNGRAHNIPTLLMHGDEDKICSVDGSLEMKEKNPGLWEVVIWKGFKHEAHNGTQDNDGECVIEKMVEFVKSL